MEEEVLTAKDAYYTTLAHTDDLPIVNDIKNAIYNATKNYKFKTSIKLPFERMSDKGIAIVELFDMLGYEVKVDIRNVLIISWKDRKL